MWKGLLGCALVNLQRAMASREATSKLNKCFGLLSRGRGTRVVEAADEGSFGARATKAIVLLLEQAKQSFALLALDMNLQPG